MSSSSGSTVRAIDEYQDESNGSNGSTKSSSSSFRSQDEHYLSGALGVPLEVFQEEIRRRVTSSSRASSSKRAKSSKTPSQDE